MIMKRTWKKICVLAFFGALAGGCGAGSTYSDKCRSSCDSSAVMKCAAMEPDSCQRDCEALTSGLSVTCATCITQANAWQNALDHRGTGSSPCMGYAFPSISDTSSAGCGSVCK